MNEMTVAQPINGSRGATVVRGGCGQTRRENAGSESSRGRSVAPRKCQAPEPRGGYCAARRTAAGPAR
jgi:hypothetical protein